MAQVQELRTSDDFDALLDASREQPVALLKHSIACPIAARGQKEFVQLEDEGDPALYAIVVQYARDLSNHIAETLGVQHETPQVLLIADGKAVYHANHYDVSADALREAMKEARKVA